MSDTRSTSEQPMELAPNPAPAKVDGQVSAARKNMDKLTKLAEDAGVDPAALALMYEGEKR